jgi:hypothetical protein
LPYIYQPLNIQKPSNSNGLDEDRVGRKSAAEACGIEIKGNNKWITLIQNASL